MLYHCFASFKQPPLDFFKLVDSRLILMLLYNCLNLIISGVRSPITSGLMASLVRKSKVERFGMCCIQNAPVCCLTERQNVFGGY